MIEAAETHELRRFQNKPKYFQDENEGGNCKPDRVKENAENGK
jgi:hypothetical protein